MTWYRNVKLLWLLILTILLVNLWLSSIRHPLPALSGSEINTPNTWSTKNHDRIRVSTFNIYKGQGIDGKTGISRAADLLATDDIAGLQEVRAATLFNSANQAEQIARLIDSGWVFAPIQTRFYKPYIGNALLSRFPVGRWQSKPLIWTDQESQQTRSRKYRNMIVAEVVLSNKPVIIIATHLDRGDIRESQLDLLLEEFDRHDNVILMADLNSNKSSPTLSKWLLKNPQADAIGQALGVIDNRERIDWILTRGFRIADGGMVANNASDHPYYWVVLESIP